MTKKIFDYLVALLGLVFLFPLIFLGIIASSVSTRSFGIFSQRRVGLHGKEFKVYKLKTMHDISGVPSSITALNESRITKTGHFLRRFKLDELPQIFNILKGDMSFVGPRPDVKGYVDNLQGSDRKLLNIKPGITGYASIYFSNEEQLLRTVADPKDFNDNVVFPLKVRLNLEYHSNATVLSDVELILITIFGRCPFSKISITPFRSEQECRARLGNS